MVANDVEIDRQGAEQRGHNFYVRHSLIPDDQPETTLQSADSTVDPLVVVVRVTNQCSLRCQFCAYSRELPRSARHIESAKLIQLGEQLQALKVRTGRPVLVSWLGGEPFQWPQWIELSQEFSVRLGLQLGVTTNGLALRSKLVRSQALELFSQITISIDGLEDQHDSLRQAPGLFRQLSKVVSQLVQDRDPQATLLRVNTVLTQGNIASFPEFCTRMAEWGFDELTFNPLGGKDRPEFFPANRLRPEQIDCLKSQLPTLRADCEKLGMKICGSPAYLDRMSATANGKSIPIADCRPGESFLFVDEFGRISPCSFTIGEFDTLHGESSANESTSKSSLASLDLADLSHEFRAIRANRCLAACKDCHANHVFAKFR